MTGYGKELILDLHNCLSLPCSRCFLEYYFIDVCDLIDMERADLHFWDYEGCPDEYSKAEDHLKGISAIQFIKTSNITIHTLDVLRCVYLNIFSCKDFKEDEVVEFTKEYFQGSLVSKFCIIRV